MHAKNKPIPHDNDDALLRTVADLTIGYSGAELANLLNEAAILAVGVATPPSAAQRTTVEQRRTHLRRVRTAATAGMAATAGAFPIQAQPEPDLAQHQDTPHPLPSITIPTPTNNH